MKTRKPTGAVPWPLILIEGGEKAGKSWACAVLSASEKVGQTYWLDLGEGSADEYGAIPGANYLIVEHNGSFGSILTSVAEIHGLAQQALNEGGKPIVLVIDSMTAEWDWLKDWATDRAKGSASNKKKLERDPAAEIVVSGNYWNDANSRHRKLMRLLMTFPGIAIMTARGKVVAAIGENGQPIEGRKEYRVEGQKTLAFDASCWVRLSRDQPAMVVGCRSVHTGIRPGRDEPQTLGEDWTLEALIFDALKCDPTTAHTRDLVDAKPERSPEEIREEALFPSTDLARLGVLHQEAQSLGYESVIVMNEQKQEELLLTMIRRIATIRQSQGPATEQQHQQLNKLWDDAADFGRESDRLAFMGEILKREVTSAKDLTFGEAKQVGNRLMAVIKQNTPPEETAAQPAMQEAS